MKRKFFMLSQPVEQPIIKSEPDAIGLPPEIKSVEPDSSLKPFVKIETPPDFSSPEKKAEEEIKHTPLSPISENVKLIFIEKLRKADLALLKQALIDAALNKHRFPRPINEKLDNLQYALLQNKENVSVRTCIEQAIV